MRPFLWQTEWELDYLFIPLPEKLLHSRTKHPPAGLTEEQVSTNSLFCERIYVGLWPALRMSVLGGPRQRTPAWTEIIQTLTHKGIRKLGSFTPTAWKQDMRSRQSLEWTLLKDPELNNLTLYFFFIFEPGFYLKLLPDEGVKYDRNIASLPTWKGIIIDFSPFSIKDIDICHC